jgi:hypothetical protein
MEKEDSNVLTSYLDSKADSTGQKDSNVLHEVKEDSNVLG